MSSPLLSILSLVQEIDFALCSNLPYVFIHSFPLWYMIHNFNLKVRRHFHSRKIMFQLAIKAPWRKSFPGELFLEKERQFNFKFIFLEKDRQFIFDRSLKTCTHVPNESEFLKRLHNSIVPTRIRVFPEWSVHFVQNPVDWIQCCTRVCSSNYLK